MNKTTKYLPLHPSMVKFLKIGMTVIHNGNTGRCGLKGHIKSISDRGVHIQYHSDRVKEPQWYSVEWFLAEFYVIASDIMGLKGFKGRDYFNKYKDFCKTPHELLKQQPKHKEIKAEADERNKVGHTSCVLVDVDTNKSEGVIASLLNLLLNGNKEPTQQEITSALKEQVKQDPLDEVGEFFIANAKNLKNHDVARTQRLANRKAESLAEKYSGDFIVLKKVSQTEAVRKVKIKNL